MSMLKNSKNIINNSINCVKYYLDSDSRINNLQEDYELEFYLDNSFKDSFKVNGPKEIISRCLSIYEKFLNENVYKDKIEDFEEDLDVSEIIGVSCNQNGVVNIKINLKIVSSDNSFYKKDYTIEMYVYEKDRLKNEVYDYITNKGLSEEQKNHILDIFEENRVYYKNLECILEILKEEIKDLMPEYILRDLIKDGDYTLTDVVKTDFSEDILNLIDKNNEIYKIYKDVVSVKKTEDGYAIMFCNDIIHKIKYKIELSF